MSATASTGAVVVHGFTGNPASMRGVAEALAAAGFHVEMPLLPGHGTVVDDMLPTRWADWVGRGRGRLPAPRQRAEHIVVAGLSMGGALTLRLGADHPEIAGSGLHQPRRPSRNRPRSSRCCAEMVDGGTAVMPGIGSDIADPDAKETAYEGTPIEPLLSLLVDGLAPLGDRVPRRMRMPLLLLTPRRRTTSSSRCNGDFLAEHYGGPVERVSLERSYHVATQDYDKRADLRSDGRVRRRRSLPG